MGVKYSCSVKIPQRDELHLYVEFNDSGISDFQLRAVGCQEFLNLVNEYRPKIKSFLETFEISSLGTASSPGEEGKSPFGETGIRKKKSARFSIEEPQGKQHGTMLLREFILKLKGQWLFPYPENELCHCRRISTQMVDQAILSGANSVEDLRRITSAGTGCGTCQKTMEEILEYRCGPPSKLTL